MSHDGSGFTIRTDTLSAYLPEIKPTTHRLDSALLTYSRIFRWSGLLLPVMRLEDRRQFGITVLVPSERIELPTVAL